MPIEVDQSNKIERIERDTVLALSDDRQYAIVIPAKVKRKVTFRLRRKGTRKTIYLRLFAAGLFILLRAHLADIIGRGEQIFIDAEYEGHESKIKGMLLRQVYAAGIRLPKEMVTFAPLGDRSGAHHVAWQVQRGKRAPDYRVSLEELLALLE